MTAIACPCGTASIPADANFCPACGRTLGARTCACGAALGPQARFCHRCGRSAAGPGAVPVGAAPVAASASTAPGPDAALEREQSKTPWLVSGVLIAGLLGIVIWRAYDKDKAAPAAPVMANAGNAAPGGGPVAGGPVAGGPAAPFAGPGVPEGRAPDISNLTPKERYQRLFNRIMMAGERGDQATVTNFTPMALGAYEQLPARDQGDRFDAGLLHLQVNQLVQAKALADTIRLNGRTNLLADALLATIARAEQQPAAERAALQTFAANWAAEQAQKRPEYELRSGLLALVKARADSVLR